jgi:type IV pilus assembly protein PilV
MTKHTQCKSQRGFSLIEVLVSTLVISVGALGMAGLQVTAKRAGYEAVQRTTATSLTTDILERLRANPSNLAGYAASGLGGGSITSEPSPACNNVTTANCSAAELAAHDLWAWEQAIDGATELSASDAAVGGLLNPTGCITVNGRAVTIAIAWEGYQELGNPGSSNCGAGAGKYGDNDARRQVLVVNTYVGEL